MFRRASPVVLLATAALLVTACTSSDREDPDRDNQGSARTGFPGPDNTGVPDDVDLKPYTGPSTITEDGTVIDGRKVVGRLEVAARDVVVRRSSIRGNVEVTGQGSVTLVDSTVDGGYHQGGAVGPYNVTLERVEVVGAGTSVSCSGNCHIKDSWLHDQYMKPGSNWHGDGFLTNGGDNMTLEHNTLACDSEPTDNGGACSAALAAYGDFAPVTRLTVVNNLFVASPAGYCLYGGADPGKPFGARAEKVVVRDNVFERGETGNCALYGPAAAVPDDVEAGHEFSGNVWDDGQALNVP